MSLTSPSKNVFDGKKGYKRVRYIGDRLFQDFEAIEVQQAQDLERTRLGDRIFAEGAIVEEAGGTISPARQGVRVGNVAAISSGAYQGFFTQIYTLIVVVGGGPGTAVIQVSSDGPDNGVEGAGYEFSIDLGDPLDGSMTYDVGLQGVKVAFNDSKVVKNFIAADSWTILGTHNRSLPVVDAGASTITPKSAAIYSDGRILTVPSLMLSYVPKVTGSDVVYVEVIRDIVTGDADPSLKAAFTNLNVAERERILAVFKDRDTSNDALPPNAISRKVYPAYLWNRATNRVERASTRSFVFTLDEIPGQLPASSLADLELSEELRGILAELVNDITGGSYRIDGLKARVSTNPPATGKVNITVEKGKARISGLKILKGIEEDIPLDLATDAVAVIGEAKTFATGTNVYALNKAVGANKLPIKDVTLLTAIVQITRSITKGSANGLDQLPDQPVASIVSVAQGVTTYTATTDYIQNGNFVDWSPAGAEPTSGSSYDVTYRYTKQMVQPSDFTVIDSDSDGDLDAVDFSPGGDNPVNGTTILINYRYYQPRIDVIYLRTDATFAFVKGSPADFPVAPDIPTESLGIASVNLGPNSSSNITVTNFDNQIVTMAQLRFAIKREEDLIRNDALQDLLNQTKIRESAAFKDLFADAFATEDFADLTFNRPAGTGGTAAGSQITYDCLLDLFELLLELPITPETKVLVANDTLVPGSQTKSAFNRDFVTLPFTEVLEISQDNWSEQRNINPFATFSPPEGEILLIPDHDNGVNVSITTKINDYWLRRHKKLRPLTQHKLEKLLKHPKKIKSRSVEEVSRLVEERAGLFMRQITVEVRGKRFAPGEDNIVGTFDGKTVALTPINGTPAGTQAGTVKARPSTFDVNNEVVTLGGDWEATFTIPANVPVGVRSFVAAGDSGDDASATYDGELEEREITIFQREIFVIKDPLAQTFGFSVPTTLTRIDVPFSAKGPNSESPLELQLRDVELPGGLPGTILYESVIKKAEELNIGDTSSNVFQFGNPMLQQGNLFRALVFMTDSNKYQVYTATLGRAGLNPAAFITSNPNLRGSEPAGILLESLNAVNWEANSRAALRYKLYRADFSPESWVYFTRISSVNYSQLFLNVDQVVPENTTINWQVSIDGLDISNPSKAWIDIVPFETLDLGVTATTIDVRVKLTTSDSRVSPYINLKNWHLEGTLFKAAGKYIAKMRPQLVDITQVKIYVEVQAPAVTTVSFFASNAEDSSQNTIWEPVTTVDADVDLGDGFHELSLSKTLNNAIADKTSKRKMRIRVDMTTSNQAITPLIRRLSATYI